MTAPEDRLNETGCPFCAIVNAGAPAKVVREWADAICIEPLNPVTPGHLLVMSKVHVQSFFSSPDVSALTMRRAAELLHGVERYYDARDYNIITSVGEAATQTVKHLHVHVVPRQHGDGLALPWAPSADEASLADDVSALRVENAALNEKLRAALSVALNEAP
jgi:histidine triad (HIT) family protein